MSARRRELLLVLAFTAAAFVPFMGKAIHMDEPFFLAQARQIAAHPSDPLGFEFNWYGQAEPMARLNNTPLPSVYLIAMGWAVSGGSEFPFRLFFLPFDLASAAALFLLAARFLKRPFWPVLAVLAAPAWLVSMNLVYPEKFCAALGLWGLYAWVRGVDEHDDLWRLAGAVLIGAAPLAKYSGVVFLVPMAAYALSRGMPWKKAARWLALAASGLALYFGADLLLGREAAGAAWRVTAESGALPTAAWSHRLRSALAFVGGAGLAAAVWAAARTKPRVLLACAAAAAALYSSFFDLAPLVRGTDRLTGLALGAGALAALWPPERRDRGQALWLPWTAAVLALSVLAYWSILARQIAFLVPPLVFAAAAGLEASWPWARVRPFYAATVAASLALSLAVAFVDQSYAGAQRDAAREAGFRARTEGRRLWFAGHWGLQYYMEREGAKALDTGKGGWAQVGRGDLVLVPGVNSNILRPPAGMKAKVATLTVFGLLPLRLISGWTGEGGFYSNTTGFLPFSLSDEPLDEFQLIEKL